MTTANRTQNAGSPISRRSLIRTLAAAAAAAAAPVASGCSGSGSGAGSNKTKLRVALCQQALGNGMPELLRKKFPDVEFQFTQAQNAAAYYAYLNEHDDLPDIVTVRRFSLRDAAQLKDALVDLSSSEVASGYYQNYINNYTYDDGVVNWLPATAEIWSIVANKSLFDEKGIALPTDYASFKAACDAFEAQGIRGFVSDWSYDYTCLETLEGFNANALQSLEGRRWRSQYESVSTDALDDAVWPAAFSHMQEVLADTKNNTADTINLGFSDVQKMFSERQAAMIRSSGAEMAGFTADVGDDFVMLPYFGASEDENWVLTYPNFQMAMSSKSKVDSKLLNEVFEYILGQDVQDALNTSNNDSKSYVLSYTSAVSIETSEQLSTVKSYFDNNQVFTRLANNDFFEASQTAVSGLIDGSMDATAAYNAFNESLKNSSSEVSYDLNFEKGYSYDFQDGKGSESASALLNTCREVWGTDLAVAYATSFSNSIYEGKAATSQLKYLVAGNYGPLYKLDLTGAQVKDVVKRMVEQKTGDGVQLVDSLNPVTDDMLPVSSGFEMQIKRGDGQYTLEGVSIDGKGIDESKTYSIVVNFANTAAADIIFKGIDVPEGANKGALEFPKALAEYFADTTKQFVEPSAYIKLS